MTEREALDVLEMFRLPAWKLFAKYVQEQCDEHRQQALTPISCEADVYECERAKSAEAVTNNLLKGFEDHVRNCSLTKKDYDEPV